MVKFLFLLITLVSVTTPSFAADSSSGASVTNTSGSSSVSSVFGDYNPLQDSFGKEEDKYTGQRSAAAETPNFGNKNQHYRSPYSTERGYRQSAKARLAKFKAENKGQSTEENLKTNGQ